MVEVCHLHDLGSHDPTADQICIPKFLKKINYICVLSVAGDLNITHLVKVLYTCKYGWTYHAPKKHVPFSRSPIIKVFEERGGNWKPYFFLNEPYMV